MRSTIRALLVSATLSTISWASLSGCVADSSDDSAGQASCIAGQVASCPCADGTMGTASCTQLGSFGSCMCGVAGAGGMASSGAGGTTGAGAGGMSGLGGSGGVSGLGGASGAAGMTVEAGSGGAGGLGGMGGTAGMAGAGGMSGGMGGASGTSGDGGDVPDGAYCAAAADWDPAWTAFEEEVLRLTNEARAAGHNCDSEGNFGPADPLMMSPILRCSSRLHSMDMGDKGYFDHTAPDGRDPFDRMADAGYSGRAMGENIAKGQQTPAEVVQGWLDSDGHCANIMNPSFTEIGVGYWEGPPENMFFNGNKLWTQNFGLPAGGSAGCPFPPQFCN